MSEETTSTELEETAGLPEVALPPFEAEVKVCREWPRNGNPEAKFISLEVKLPGVCTLQRDGVDANGQPMPPKSLIPRFEVQVSAHRSPQAFNKLKKAEDGDLIRLKGFWSPQRARIAKAGDPNDRGFLKSLAIIEATEVRILTTRVRVADDDAI